VHALLDDKNQAIYAYQRSEVLKDSIFLSEKANWAEQSEASYNLGKKDAEINSLEQSAILKESDLQQQRAFNVALVVIVILGTILTITVIQNLKQQRKRKEELERRVKEQTLDLLNATNKLKQSYYELERFAFIASHDFKEPVRNIGTFISLIQRKLEKQEDTELRDYLHYCKESAKRLHNLMEDATAFLRLSDRKVAKQEIELNSIIQRTWEKLDAQHAKLYIEAESQSIKGYEEDIEILLKQLIENGLKYNRSKQPHISIQIESQATSNIIRIQDNGVGIEDRHKEKVMGMFTRAFHEYEGKGSGLGLAICKKIMDLHNGKISLESEVGKGTTVYLSFPN
jgi:light-regulated signal transduction histidine kinase (bacteriophytochrome)